MKRRWLAILLLASQCQAFNLISDIQSQTNWDVGRAASGGTAIALAKNDALNVKAGDFVPSALAEISDYRMFSVWYGGNEFTFADGTTHWKDTAKIGLNLAYFLNGFANKPPALLQNLVVGPSMSFNIVTSPHVFVPFLDVNFVFQGNSSK